MNISELEDMLQSEYEAQMPEDMAIAMQRGGMSPLQSAAPTQMPAPQRMPQRAPAPQMQRPQQMPQQVGPEQIQQQLRQQYMTNNSIPYTVSKGDNFTKIARLNGVSVQELKKFNPQIQNINRIFPGQEIRIPLTKDMIQEAQQSQLSDMGMSASPMLQQVLNEPEYWRNRRNMDPNQRMQQDLGMGMLAGAGPMAAIAAPMAPGAAAGALARMPRINPINPGRVQFPMSKGAVDWPGASKTFSNVRPYPERGGLPASRAAAQGALNQLARQQRLEPRGMSGVPFDPVRGLNLTRNAPNVEPPMSAWESILANMGI